jgi:hypothetical protein
MGIPTAVIISPRFIGECRQADAATRSSQPGLGVRHLESGRRRHGSALTTSHFAGAMANCNNYSSGNENYDCGHRVTLSAGGGYEATVDINLG